MPYKIPLGPPHLIAHDYHAVFKSVAKPAVPSLIKLLNESDPSILYGAAFCLCQIGPAAAEEAVPALSNGFQSLQCLKGVGTDVARADSFVLLAEDFLQKFVGASVSA